MAPRLKIGSHRYCEFRSTHAYHRPVGVAFLAILLLSIFTYSQLEARTEPRIDSESTDVDSNFGTSRSLSGDVPISVLSGASRWDYINYSKDFPEVLETPQLPVPEHPNVLKFVHYYQGEGRSTFVSALKSSWIHVPQMMEVLKSYEIPAELVYLVFVESRFSNVAVSPRGAAGCWQLMPDTARRLGLRVDKRVDERYDSVKSTHAAARYLRRLYDTFHSWPLAIAAYNVGEQTVLRAVGKHADGDFSRMLLSGRMPASGFVSKVYAAIVIARDLEGFGFERPRFMPLDGSDFVWVRSNLSLQQVAQWVESSVEELRTLNPSLRSDHVPLGEEAFCLRLPSQTSPKFKLAYQQHLSKDNDS
jgi:membrane-bound lytic murein transglycosylase D